MVKIITLSRKLSNLQLNKVRKEIHYILYADIVYLRFS